MEAITEQQTTPVPSWLQLRYGQLWEQFGYTAFTLDQATAIIGENKSVVNVILSRLRKAGWVSVNFDEKDFRRRIYNLIEPSAIFRKIRGINKNEQDNKH